MPAAAPTSAMVVDHLEACAAAHPDLVHLRHGRSREGRPLVAAVCADPAVDGDHLLNAVVVAGRHGNEESGRGIALACLDWALGPGRAVLKTHRLAILADANPDAAEANVYHHPCGIDVVADLDEAEPIPESRFIADLLDAVPPDVLVDLHACGHVGCTHDLVLWPEQRAYTEDANTVHAVAAELCTAAQAASGIPQLHHPMRWWSESDTGLCLRAYRGWKALALLIETAESDGPAHPWDLRIASGLAKIQRLLALGAERHPRLADTGYATDLVIGSYHLGLVAAGAGAAQRRASRVALWRQASNLRIGYAAMPQADAVKQVVVEHSGTTIAMPCGVQVQVRHRDGPRRVTVDGIEVRPTAVWRQGGSTFVTVVLSGLEPGQHRIDLVFADDG